MNYFRKPLHLLRAALARLLIHIPCDSTFLGPPRMEISSTPAIYAVQSSTAEQCRSFIPVNPRRLASRKTPAYADKPIAELFDEMRSGVIKEQFVVQLERGRYWGRCAGYIINSSDCLHRDLSPDFLDVTLEDSGIRHHDAMIQPFLPRVHNIPGTVAAINTLFASNFHHWLLDCVPKFSLIEAAGLSFSEIDFFILPARLLRWHKEVLSRLEIPPHKIICSSQGMHVRADNLIVPSSSEPSRQPNKYSYSPEGLDFVRTLILRTPMSQTEYPKKIIVSREKTRSRRLVNGDAIHSRLEREGFVKIILENHSLYEQAKIFHSAKRIIMPTGGGLANLAFCSGDAKVYELFDPTYMPTFSLLLASHLGFEYTALVGDNKVGGVLHSDAGNKNDIMIPIEKLLAHATA